MNKTLANLLGIPALACCLSTVVAGAAFGASRSQFAATDITQPDFFPILPWDPYHGWKQPHIETRRNGLESMAECHFNMAGFVLPKDLQRCCGWGLDFPASGGS